MLALLPTSFRKSLIVYFDLASAELCDWFTKIVQRAPANQSELLNQSGTGPTKSSLFPPLSTGSFSRACTSCMFLLLLLNWFNTSFAFIVIGQIWLRCLWSGLYSRQLWASHSNSLEAILIEKISYYKSYICLPVRAFRKISLFSKTPGKYHMIGRSECC